MAELDIGILITIASIIAGFGITMLFFRISRELKMNEKGEPSWIPYSDWLMVCAVLISLILVILPGILDSGSLGWLSRVPKAASTASIILVIGYIPGILAHYRLIFGRGKFGPRHNPESSERIIVLATAICSIVAFIAVFL